MSLNAQKESILHFYVGTYSPETEDGIFHFQFNSTTGEAVYLRSNKGGENPSYLAIHPCGKFLYAVNETGSFQGQESGSLRSYAMDGHTDEWQLMNQQASQGTAPCYLSVDDKGRFLFTANYGSGSSSVFPIKEDGSIGAAMQVMKHQGRGPHPTRQEGPHAHSITLTPDQSHVLVADLGIDQVIFYRFLPDEEKEILQESMRLSTKPGAGPRHLCFHPDGKHLFLINELDSSLSLYSYDLRQGTYEELQTLSTLPAGFAGENTCADIHCTDRYVYGSNRGDDSIVIFEFDSQAEQLRYVAHQSTLGKTPRNFVIDPSGQYLLAANQDSDSIVIFSIESETGLLRDMGQHLQVRKPVCLKFL